MSSGAAASAASSSASAAAASAAAASSAACAVPPAPAPQSSPLRTLEQLRFDNLALRALPIDKETGGGAREVKDACFSLVEPTPVKNPQLVCYSPDVLRWIELDEREATRPDFVEYMSGNRILPGVRPAAHCYAGHQFGHFSGQLGDGAAMYLGEVLTSRGERVEIQFKGAGRTPYSRDGDGRKVLRSSLREFLCSEAHHYLGIPTTRAGTIVTSDSRVERDPEYDGNVILERATIITRLAPSFIRFGSFEIAKQTDPTTGRAGPSAGNTQIVNQLLDYAVDTFYRDATASVPESEGREGKYLAFFRELMRRTALLVAKWQSVGWCHGVLNTDNMSILGLTIDYGPFGFMEAFDPEYICNGSDSDGRYRYESQPEICGWNLMKLSQMLEPFAPRDKLRVIVGEFEDMFLAEYDRIMRRKLGLGLWTVGEQAQAQEQEQDDDGASVASIDEADEGKPAAAAASAAEDTQSPSHSLIQSLFSVMSRTGADFTRTFRVLGTCFRPDDDASFSRTLESILSHCASASVQASMLPPRMEPSQARVLMHVLRNDPAAFEERGMEGAMEALQEEMSRAAARETLRGMSPQEKERRDRGVWVPWLRSYETVLRTELHSAVRSTGRSRESLLDERRRVQNANNPKFVLRNWMLQQIIDEAEKGDFRPVEECLRRLRDPFDVDDEGEEEEAEPTSDESAAATKKQAPDDGAQPAASSSASGQCPLLRWNGKRPDWANNLRVTCSS